MDIDVSELPSDSAKSLYNTISGATFASAASEFTAKHSQSIQSQIMRRLRRIMLRHSSVIQLMSMLHIMLLSVMLPYHRLICKSTMSTLLMTLKTSGYYREADEYVSSH